jgi:hypothetical protein
VDYREVEFLLLIVSPELPSFPVRLILFLPLFLLCLIIFFVPKVLILALCLLERGEISVLFLVPPYLLGK